MSRRTGLSRWALPLSSATRTRPPPDERGTRRPAPLLISIGLLAGGCGGGLPAATTAPVAAPAAPAAIATSTISPSTPLAASASGSPAPVAEWTGPVRAPSTGGTTQDDSGGRRSAQDEEDAARTYVDIERVSVDSPSQPHWRITLAAAPPHASTLDPTRTVISYGLALETSGDDAPDYVVGISNEASTPGHFLVWVTDLATGETEEQDGPPYGYPVEFRHPNETQPGDPGELEMVFTFLGPDPSGATSLFTATPDTRFYAWSSVSEDGTVVAWDYAPDLGWVGDPPGAAAPPDVEPAPVPIGNPDAPVGMPECDAREYDYIGEGTLRGLGLHTATPVMPDGIDRPARIWVTRDLLPRDPGPPGGPVEVTRMLCFEFADGSGGSGWPVDPAWQPPNEGAIVAGDADAGGLPQAILAVALVALLLVAVSALAFRGRD